MRRPRSGAREGRLPRAGRGRVFPKRAGSFLGPYGAAAAGAALKHHAPGAWGDRRRLAVAAQVGCWFCPCPGVSWALGATSGRHAAMRRGAAGGLVGARAELPREV